MKPIIHTSPYTSYQDGVQLRGHGGRDPQAPRGTSRQHPQTLPRGARSDAVSRILHRLPDAGGEGRGVGCLGN